MFKKRRTEEDILVISADDLGDSSAGARQEKKKKEASGIFLLKKTKSKDKVCAHSVRTAANQRVLTIDCSKCTNGKSSLGDTVCRKNIFRILIDESVIDRLILSHLNVKEYDGDSLKTLCDAARFIENSMQYSKTTVDEYEECKNCRIKRGFLSIIDKLPEDPICSYFELRDFAKKEVGVEPNEEKCKKCTTRYAGVIDEICALGSFARALSPGRDCSYYYENCLRPYVRPKFTTSRIHMEPPKDAVFIRSYDVQKGEGRPMRVAIYGMTDRPESLYFIIPEEYNLLANELEILDKTRSKFIRQRPGDTDVIDRSKARQYFMRRSRQMIAEVASEMKIDISPGDIQRLSDIFTKYTAGLGVLEDMLSDEHVQDIYVNAPVSINPLQVVVDDEECATNVYLSEDDLEAMISRFRSISGRPFSEATPVLDMGLKDYRTRVSVVGSPLSKEGIAYAFRRHRNEPWTLPLLISKGMLSPLAAGLISFLMDGQSTVLVAGDVGSGKTSLLTSMILEIPQKYRILTIEDTPEIPIEKIQRLGWKVQGLSTQSAVAGSMSEVKPEVALRAALRLGNSALVMGEVRGPEVKTLYEAMQVGSAGNSVIGTIHGASTSAVYERIVNSLNVPLQSFKVTDAVIVCARTRTGGGMQKKRRIMQVSEIVKSKTGSDIFADIMLFDASKDELVPTEILDMGQSEVVKKIAGRWGISVDEASENIRVRASIKEAIVTEGKKNPDLLEVGHVAKANNMFWFYVDAGQKEHGAPDYNEIYGQWGNWYKNYVKGQDGRT